MSVRRTARWNLVLAVGVTAIAVGVLLEEPVLLLLAVPSFVFAAYSHASPVVPQTVAVEREVAPSDPDHGEHVTVSVSVQNVGDRYLPDVRLVDGVPAALPVRDGPARHAAALAPGAKTQFTYTVIAKRGIHRFDQCTAVLGNTSGTATVGMEVGPETRIACRSRVRTLPFPPAAPAFPGGSSPEAGASGITFDRLREYRRSDSFQRIDWNRYARHGELSTVVSHEQRSPRLVLCLDARPCAYRSAGPNEPGAVSYERAAARELLAATRNTPVAVGLGVCAAELRWIEPGPGDRTRSVVSTSLERPSFLPVEPPEGIHRTRTDDQSMHVLRQRIQRGTWVVLLTPLLDEDPLETARELRTAGHPVTVVSPDVTAAESTGTRVAALDRANRIDRLRRAGIHVVDWVPGDPLEEAIRNGIRR